MFRIRLLKIVQFKNAFRTQFLKLHTTRRMSVQLIWACDRYRLYNELERRNEEITISIRQMIWLITGGIVKEGGIYVDEWPEFNHVCCLHPSKLYAPRSDRDFVSMVSSDKNGQHNQADNRSSFLEFFNSLVVERQWMNRDGAVLFYVPEWMVEIARQVLCPQSGSGKFWISKPLRQYTAAETKYLREYEIRRKAFMANFDPSLIIDRLHPDEGHLVAEQWPYGVPDKELMCQWLVSILPSVCIRQKTTARPLAWMMAYSNGGSAAGYVVPERRGQGLADAFSYHCVPELAKILPNKRFFWILDDNIASYKMTRKVYFDMIRSELFFRILVYDSPKATKGVKSKM